MRYVMGFEKDVKLKIVNAVDRSENINVFAKACGVDHATLARYLRGDQRGLGFGSLAKILDHIDSTLPVKSLTPHGPAGEMQVVQSEEDIPNGLGISIPVYHLVAGGLPMHAEEVEPLCHTIIPMTFVRPGMQMAQVEGNSMAPTIRHGAYIAIDGRDTKIVPGEIYVVNAPYEGATVKRVFVDTQQGQLVLKSDNPGHDDQRIDIDGRDDLIVGRVFWVGQET